MGEAGEQVTNCLGSLVLKLGAAMVGVVLLAGAGDRPRIMSLSYTPSGIANEAQMQRGFSEAKLRVDLKRVAIHTGRIRTYSMDYGLDRIPRVAQELGLKVSLGLWLGPDRDQNRIEIAKALGVVAAYPGTVDRLYVGNETLVRGDLPAEELVGYVRDVKRALAGKAIRIATAEPWHIWLKHPELAAEVDFIGTHVFAFWDGVPVAAAVDYVAGRFDELKKTYPQKPIVIAETGWPSVGPNHEAAVASPEAQGAFLRQFLRRAAEAGYDYNIVEAFDQPWKAPEERGAIWGIFDDVGMPKFTY